MSGTVQRLRLRVIPGAPRSGFAGRLADGRLKVRIAAPAREGRANQALIEFLARRLGVRRSAVRLVTGAAARDKVVEVEAAEEALLRLCEGSGEEESG